MIRFDNDDPEKNQFHVFLGQGSISVGHLVGDNYKGLCLQQLKVPVETGADVKWDNIDQSFSINLLVENEKGVVALRRGVEWLEGQYGMREQTIGNKLANGLQEELGELREKIRNLTEQNAFLRMTNDAYWGAEKRRKREKKAKKEKPT